MNLLVTGGAGFIGSHFVLRHVAAHPGDRVVVLDKLTYAGRKEFLKPVLPSIVFVQGDIADRALVSSLVKDHSIETIVNFAAETHVDNSIVDASPFLQTNILGVQTLIDVCREFPATLLFHISTDEVFGDLKDGEPGKTTDDPLRPSSPYAASKAASELLLQAAVRTFGIRCRVTRCTNNFGPHQAQEKFIPTVIRCALNDQKIPLYGEGKNKRDWLFVTDHTDAIELLIAHPFSPDDSLFYHVSADDELQNIEVAKRILAVLKKPESLLSFVTDRPGHDWRYALDSAGTRALGWKPRVSFDQGLYQCVEWYVSGSMPV